MKNIVFFIIFSLTLSRPIKKEDWNLKSEKEDKIIAMIKDFSDLSYIDSIRKMKEPFVFLQAEIPELLNNKGIDQNFCTMDEIISLLTELNEIVDDKKEFFYFLPRYIKKFWLPKAKKFTQEIELTKTFLDEIKEEYLNLAEEYFQSEGVFSEMVTCRFPVSDNEWGEFFGDEDRFKIAISEIIKERNKKSRTVIDLGDEEEPYMSPLETITIDIYELTERVQSYLFNMEYNVYLPIYYVLFEQILLKNYESWTDEQIYDFVQYMATIFMKEIQQFQVFSINFVIDLKKNRKMFKKEVDKIGIFKNIDEEIYPINMNGSVLNVFGVILLFLFF